jgi:hypothetical protein
MLLARLANINFAMRVRAGEHASFTKLDYFGGFNHLRNLINNQNYNLERMENKLPKVDTE